MQCQPQPPAGDVSEARLDDEVGADLLRQATNRFVLAAVKRLGHMVTEASAEQLPLAEAVRRLMVMTSIDIRIAAIADEEGGIDDYDW
jgi:hypothetical protein